MDNRHIFKALKLYLFNKIVRTFCVEEIFSRIFKKNVFIPKAESAPTKQNRQL